jgi:glycosyltransferase involved in cell wall biosynthesis
VTEVHVVVPEGVDDPTTPSGGNVYDRRLVRELTSLGWSVHQHVASGSWPTPTPGDRTVLERIVSGLPDRAVALVDGLVASAAPDVLVPHARRLRLVVLVHMPLSAGAGTSGVTLAREQAVLAAAAAVLTTSAWTRGVLVERLGVPAPRVHVAEPGVDVAEPAVGTAAGGELLCVAAVAPHKGHDVLLTALASLRERSWRCTCVGPLDRDHGFVDRLERVARSAGVGDRLRFTGPLTGAALDAAYAGADVLVLPSRGETYGMVVTEALARGLPVIATTVGGLPDTLGPAEDRPGLLVPPDRPDALAAALASWLDDPALRRRLRRAAELRRSGLHGWRRTGASVARVLQELV